MGFCHVTKAVVSFNLEIGERISSLALTISRMQTVMEWRKNSNIDFKKCLRTYLLYAVNTIETQCWKPIQ